MLLNKYDTSADGGSIDDQLTSEGTTGVRSTVGPPVRSIVGRSCGAVAAFYHSIRQALQPRVDASAERRTASSRIATVVRRCEGSQESQPSSLRSQLFESIATKSPNARAIAAVSLAECSTMEIMELAATILREV